MNTIAGLRWPLVLIGLCSTDSFGIDFGRGHLSCRTHCRRNRVTAVEK